LWRRTAARALRRAAAERIAATSSLQWGGAFGACPKSLFGDLHAFRSDFTVLGRVFDRYGR
jgi:hypothetical protein